MSDVRLKSHNRSLPDIVSRSSLALSIGVLVAPTSQTACGTSDTTVLDLPTPRDSSELQRPFRDDRNSGDNHGSPPAFETSVNGVAWRPSYRTRPLYSDHVGRATGATAPGTSDQHAVSTHPSSSKVNDEVPHAPPASDTVQVTPSIDPNAETSPAPVAKDVSAKAGDERSWRRRHRHRHGHWWSSERRRWRPRPPVFQPDCPDETPAIAPWQSGIDERPPAAVLSLPSTLEVAPPGWIAVEAFPELTFDDPVAIAEPPGAAGTIFVAEREGRLYAFENDPAVREKRLVLDLSQINQGNNDSGLLGFAFHPEFGQADSPNRAFVYLHYAYTDDPWIDAIPPSTKVTMSRLVRFTVDPITLVFDPSSELILIDQLDENIWHQGGAMFFHPSDGFLYLAVGDEGDFFCTHGNCQRIDNDLFSGVLRIDVDMRGGDVSHPIPKQPATGATANYYIPNDNPFVGQPGALEEFYALGLRSPHRMTYDVIDDITWIGEVGEFRREELNVLGRAANYQWNVFEGTLTASMAMPPEPLGVWTGPVLEYPRVEGASVIGGYVYRGSRLPYLYGKYVFADFVSGNVWALSYQREGTGVRAVERELLVQTPFRDRINGITSFGVDLNEELYILTLGKESKLHRLDRTGGFSNAPLYLSETGVFTDTAQAELQVSPGFLPYDVKSPLWSDGALKYRWVSIPDDGTVTFSETGSWSFPEGTVFVKHFELALDETRPNEVRRLETRLLVHGANNTYYGLTYKWDEAGTDAQLVPERQIEPIEVNLANGDTRDLEYLYPGPGDCGVCHNPDAGEVLGPRTSQLNHDLLYPQTNRRSNQLFTWAEAGLLDRELDEASIRALVSLSSPSDSAAPLEDRVRSYWASNCSMCHGSVGGLRANWDARHEVPLEEQGVIYGISQSATAPEAFLVVPGDPDGSVLFRRSTTTDPMSRMPPLGRSSTDPVYASILRQWIQSLE